jgi:putative addiction module component (TIGR02574 family)
MIDMSEPMPDLERLTPEERLQLIERLWDSLSSPGEVPLTGAQREELDRRLDNLEGDGEGIPWDEVVRQIRNRLG